MDSELERIMRALLDQSVRVALREAYAAGRAAGDAEATERAASVTDRFYHNGNLSAIIRAPGGKAT